MSRTLRALFSTITAVVAITSVGAVASAAPAQNTAASVTPTSGVVRAIMSSDPSLSDTAVHDVVLDTAGGQIDLPDDTLENYAPGTRLTFNGTESEIESGDAPVLAATKTTQLRVSVPNRNLLVIPIQWSDSPFTAKQQQDLNQILTSLEPWWSRASTGTEDLTARTLPILTISRPNGCDVDGFRTAALSAATQVGLNEWATNISIFLPDQNECWWGGLGEMPGRISWMNSGHLKILMHEIGHNMGLPHASTCVSPTGVSLIESCDKREYGDTTDIMGSAWWTDRLMFGAPYLDRLGWLPQSHQTRWNGGITTYTLAPLDTTNGGLRAVRIDGRGILDPTAPGEYWLQFRNFPGDLNRDSGVFLVLDPTEEYARTVSTGSTQGNPTWLCDITPGQDERPSVFQLNTPWSDPSGLFTVTVTSVTATSATVTVAPGRTPPTAPTTLASDTLTTNGIADGRVKVSWTNVRPGSQSGLGEPVAVTATIDGTDRTCTAPAMTRTCIITNAPRARTLTITAVSKNYSGTSRAVSVGAAAVPTTAPTAALVIRGLTSTSVSVEVSVSSDGGTPVTSTGTIALDNGQSCATNTNPCTFTGLLPRATHTVTTVVANAAGTSALNASVTTLPQKPSTPIVAAHLINGAPFATVTAAAVDRFNVTHVSSLCSGANTGWVSSSATYSGSPVAVSLAAPALKGFCWVFAANESGTSVGVVVDLAKLNRHDTKAPVADKPGAVKRPVIRAKAVRIAKGTSIRLTWSVDGGDPSRVTVSKIAGKTCKKTGRSSCVAKGVRRGGTARITLKAPGSRNVVVRIPK